MTGNSRPFPPPGKWIERANCRDKDTRLFFPEEDNRDRTEHFRRAQAICRDCAVRAECLDYAIDNRIIHGVFGGLSERHRRVEARQRRALRGAA